MWKNKQVPSRLKNKIKKSILLNKVQKQKVNVTINKINEYCLYEMQHVRNCQSIWDEIQK